MNDKSIIASVENEQNEKRKELIKQIEDLLDGATVVAYVANFNHPLGLIYNEDVILYEDLLRSCKKSDTLYLIINSPGGLADVAEKMIIASRARFKNFNVIVPFQAKSAATMVALGSDEILMSDISELGPIDPMIGHQGQLVQAWSYIEAFEQIKSEIQKKSKKLPVLPQLYAPLLDKIDPVILDICHRAIYDSKTFAEKWLKQHMFKRKPLQAKRTAALLSDADVYVTHSKIINYADAKERLKLNVRFVDKDSLLWSTIWELFVRSQTAINKDNLSKVLISSSNEIRQTAVIHKMKSIE